MIKINKGMMFFFALIVVTMHSTLIPAEPARREGESAVDYAKRIGAGEVEGKKRAQEIQNIPLSYIDDYPYIKYHGGYRGFYESPKSHFIGLSKGKMKTFFEEWAQESIKDNNILEIIQACKAAHSHDISLEQTILKGAADKVNKLLHQGMIFLSQSNIMPPAQVHEAGRTLKQLADEAGKR